MYPARVRMLRTVVALGVASALAVAVGYGVPPIRDRLSTRLPRVISFLFVDLFTTHATWSEGRAAPSPKMEAQTAVVGGKLYVFGGFAGTTATSMAPVEPRVSVYDPVADAWSRAAATPIDVTHCNAVVVDGSVWIAGGYRGPHPGVPVANVLRYDAASDSWSEGPPCRSRSQPARSCSSWRSRRFRCRAPWTSGSMRRVDSGHRPAGRGSP